MISVSKAENGFPPSRPFISMNQDIVIIDIQIYNVHYVNRAFLDVVLLGSAQP